MIKIISLFIFCTLLHSKNCEEQYLDKVVNTSTMHSYYLVVNVQCEGSDVKKMFVQRNDFFHVLSFDNQFQKQNNREEYVKKLILKKNVFKIKNQSLVKQYFLPLSKPDKGVDSLCLLGKPKLLDAVFDSSGLQKDTPYDLGYVVQRLFELKVPVMFYGESGRLFIDRKYSCNCD